MVKLVSFLPSGYFIKVVLSLLYKTPFSDEYSSLFDETNISVNPLQ